MKRDLMGVATYEPHGKNSTPTISYTKGNFSNNDITTAMAMDFDGQRLALGGRERETILLDIATGAVLWKVRSCLHQFGKSIIVGFISLQYAFIVYRPKICLPILKPYYNNLFGQLP
jgi:hypothetical protein